MNKVYKVIWNKAKHCYVVVSELAKSQGKSSQDKRASRMSMRAAAVLAAFLVSIGGGTINLVQAAEPTPAEKASQVQTITETVDKDGKVTVNTTEAGGPIVTVGDIQQKSVLENAGIIPGWINTNGGLTDKLVGGKNGVAIGENSYAGRSGIAIGTNANKEAGIGARRGAITIGVDANAKGLYSTVLGTGSKLNDDPSKEVPVGSGFLGRKETVQGAVATVIGAYNTVETGKNGSGYASVGNNVIGAANTVTNSNGVAIQGSGNTIKNSIKDMDLTDISALDIAKGDYKALLQKDSGKIAIIGGANTVDASHAITNIGFGANISKSDGVFVAGQHNVLTGVKDSLIMGNDVNLKNIKGAISLGDRNDITGENAVAIGHENAVKGNNVVAIGQKNKVNNASGSIALGAGATVDLTNVKQVGSIGQWNGIAIGSYQTKVIDSANGIAIGAKADATNSNNSIAIGEGSSASGVSERENPKISGVSQNNTAIGQNAGVEASSYSNSESSVALGYGAKLKGSNSSIALGSSATITNGYQSIAIGNMSSVQEGGFNGTALGASSIVKGGIVDSVALGSNSIAMENNVISVGSSKADVKKYNAYVDEYNANMEKRYPGETDRLLQKIDESSVKDYYRRVTNVADGTDAHDAVTVGQLQAGYVAYDTNDGTINTDSVTFAGKDGTALKNVSDIVMKVPYQDKANGYKTVYKDLSFQKASLMPGEVVFDDNFKEDAGNSIVKGNVVAIGGNTKSTNSSGATVLGAFGSIENSNFATALGTGTTITDSTESTAIGNNASVFHADWSTAIGKGASVTGIWDSTTKKYVNVKENTAIGQFAGVDGANSSVALGAYSKVTQGEDNVVSVGNSWLKRKITNVADGVKETDAATVGQLKKKADVADLNGLVAYDKNGTEVNKDSVSFDGGEKGTSLNNVGDIVMKVPYQDASQGYAKVYEKRSFQQAGLMPGKVTWTEDFKPGDYLPKGNVVAIGHNAKSIDSSNGVVVGEFSDITNSNYGVAVGPGLTVKNSADSVTLGHTNHTYDSANAVVIGSGYKDEKNVYHTNEAVDSAKSVVIGYANSVKDSNQSVAMGSNVTIDKSNDSIALGNSSVVSGGNNNIALGTKAKVSGSDSIAIGANAQNDKKNSVALGNGSVVTEDNQVSVGNDTVKRTITNVADGKKATDAATVGQVTEATEGVKALVGSADFSRTNYAKGSENVTKAIYDVDAQVKTNADGLVTTNTKLDALDEAAVKYATTTDGDVNKSLIDFGTQNTSLKNVNDIQAKSATFSGGTNEDGVNVGTTFNADGTFTNTAAAGKSTAKAVNKLSVDNGEGYWASDADAGKYAFDDPAGGYVFENTRTFNKRTQHSALQIQGGQLSGKSAQVIGNSDSSKISYDYQLGSYSNGQFKYATKEQNTVVVDGEKKTFNYTSQLLQDTKQIAGEVNSDNYTSDNYNLTAGFRIASGVSLDGGKYIGPVAELKASDNYLQLRSNQAELAGTYASKILVDEAGTTITNRPKIDGKRISTGSTNINGAIVTLKQGVLDDNSTQGTHQAVIDSTGVVLTDTAQQGVKTSLTTTGLTTTGTVTAGKVVVNADNSGKITGLTAGTDAEDAVNKGQLDEAVKNGVAGVDASAVKYDTKIVDGKTEIDKTSVTFNPGGTATTLKNVADGNLAADSKEAVNGSQLYAEQEAREKADKTFTDKFKAYEDAGIVAGTNNGESSNIVLGTGAVVGSDVNNAVVVGRNADVSAKYGTALGDSAKVYGINSVALGADSIASENNVVSVGSKGQERRIVNVAAGTADTDAVNYGQLKKVSDVASAGFTVAFAQPDGSVQTKAIKPGYTVTVTGNNDNILAKVDDKGQVNVSLNDDLKVNSIASKNGKNKVALTDTGVTVATAQGTQLDVTGDTVTASGVKLQNGTISTSVKDGVIMANTQSLDFNKDGLTIGSKDYRDENAGSSVIKGDTITTTDANKHKTTIDGGSVTTEILKVQPDTKNSLEFKAGGLNINVTDPNGGINAYTTNANVGKDGVSLSVDNGAGANSSAKLTKDGTVFSYSETGATGATTTTIKGDTVTTKTVTAGKVVVNADNSGKITNLTEGTADTDAVNVKQLNDSVGTATEGVVKWDKVNNQYVEGQLRGVTFNGNGSLTAGGLTLDKNAVSAGESSLYIDNNQATLASGDSNVIVTKNQVKITTPGEDAISLGTNGAQFTDGKTTTTIKGDTLTTGSVTAKNGTIGNVTINNGVFYKNTALRDGSLFLGGNTPDNTVVSNLGLAVNGKKYVTKDGLNANGQKVTNVADGAVAKGSTDAVNGGQLFDVSQKVTDLDSLAVKYDSADKSSVTFGGSNGTTLKNVNDVEINLKGNSRGLVSSGITPGTVYAKADGWAEGAAADTASLAIGGGLQNSQTTSATVRGKNSIAIGSGASVDATAQELDAPLNGFDNADGVAIGVGANVSGIQGTAVGYGATVKENQGTAFGNQSVANGNKATAIGFSAVADADNSTVLGQGASVGTGADNSVALGAGSVVVHSDLKDTDKNGVVSVGSGNAERRIIHVADGVDAHDAVNKGQLDAVSGDVTNLGKIVGDGKYTSTNYIDQGDTLTTAASKLDTQVKVNADEIDKLHTAGIIAGEVTGKNSIALGQGSVAAGDNATVVGNASVTGDNGTAIGQGATAEKDATALGNKAYATENSVALGNNAVTKLGVTNAVALGANSIATESNTVSVGAKGNERKIVNVAAGTNTTDAVNYGQLQKVEETANKGFSVAIQQPDGTYNKHTYKPGDTVTVKGKNANILAGVDDKGVVNVSLNDSIKLGDQKNPGVALDGKEGTLAVKNANGGLNVTKEGTVSAWSGTNGVSVSALGTTVAGDVTVLNENAGLKVTKDLINATADDAYLTVGKNGAGLGYGDNNIHVNDQGTYVVGKFNATAGGNVGGVKFTGVNEDGLGKVTNVAAGVANTDAVNKGQLDKVSGDVTNLGKIVGDGKYTSTNYIEQGDTLTAAASKLDTQVKVNADEIDKLHTAGIIAGEVTGKNSIALGQGSVAAGDNATVVGNASVTGDNGTAIGQGATAEKDATALGNKAYATENSVALGNNAVTKLGVTNAVALGANSVATESNTVSVGAKGSERKIVNVATGIADTDAVNVGQLNSKVNAATYTAGDGIELRKDGDTKSINVKGWNNNLGGVVQYDKDGAINGVGLENGNIAATTGTIGGVGFENGSITANKGIIGGVGFENGNIAALTGTIGNVGFQNGNIAATTATIGKVTITGDGRITGVTAGTADTDAVNVSQLKKQVGSAKTEVKAADGETNITVEKTTGANGQDIYSVALQKQLDLTTAGSISFGKGNSLSAAGLTINNNTYITKDGINANSQKITNVAAGEAPTDAVNKGQLDAVGDKVTGLDNSAVKWDDATKKDSINGVGLKDGNVTANSVTAKEGNFESLKVNGKDVATQEYVDGAVDKVAGDVNDLKGKVETNTQNIAANKDAIAQNKVDIATNKENIGDVKQYEKAGINGTDGKAVTNVVDATISNKQAITAVDTKVGDGKLDSGASNLTEGINQNYKAIQDNSQAIGVLGGAVNKLDTRVDRVGAGAAALAALHPLDYDPANKWDFAAGYGHYKGANAVSIGTYYRPNETTMFSVGGSFGGGENMVNAGVSFKLGSGNSGVSTSRTAMAAEIDTLKSHNKDLEDKVAAQDKKVQELEKLVQELIKNQKADK